MDSLEAESYFIAFCSFDLLDSIDFFYGYFCIWSTAILLSCVLPALFIFAPTMLNYGRTSYFFLICLVSSAYVCTIFIHPYLQSGDGEPNLNLHTCRFTVYLSTLAKPISLYLTVLFGFERIITKILGKFFIKTKAHQELSRQLFALCIFIGAISILSTKMYQTIKIIPKNDSTTNVAMQGVIGSSDDSNNKSVQFTFKYCFRSMTQLEYGRFLSLMLIYSWLDYVLLAMIIVMTGILLVDQFYFFRFHRAPSSSIWSIHTRFFLTLSSCVILFEVILLILHWNIIKDGNNNTDSQVMFLQTMMMVYIIRSIYLPLIICLTQCHRLRELINTFLFLRPYLEQIDETDR